MNKWKANPVPSPQSHAQKTAIHCPLKYSHSLRSAPQTTHLSQSPPLISALPRKPSSTSQCRAGSRHGRKEWGPETAISVTSSLIAGLKKSLGSLRPWDDILLIYNPLVPQLLFAYLSTYHNKFKGLDAPVPHQLLQGYTQYKPCQACSLIKVKVKRKSIPTSLSLLLIAPERGG